MLMHQLMRHHAQLIASHDMVSNDEHRLGLRVIEPLGLAATFGAHGHSADQRLPTGADVVGGRDHDTAQAVGQHAHAIDQLVQRLTHGGYRGRRWAQAADGLGQFLRHATAEFLRVAGTRIAAFDRLR